MADINHVWSTDLRWNDALDLSTVDGTEQGQQRILRRLLTVPGTYIWHPEYGAGLQTWIGRNTDIPKIKALVRGQILLEPAVARIPEPQIDVEENPDGSLFIRIKYQDAVTNSVVLLPFTVEE